MAKVEMGQLTREAVEHIDSYLEGRASGPEVSSWATEWLVANRETSGLLGEAISALSNLDHEDERWDTPREDLEFYRDCLLGRRSFQPATEIRKVHN